MNRLHTPLHRRLAGAGFVVAAVALSWSLPLAAQTATPAPNKAAVEANYQRDRAACQAITTPPERSNCLSDAVAARDQALRNGPRTVPSPDQLKQNSLKRCQEHPTVEGREICERMARGEGQASGSVQGGGVIRELVTPEPAPPPPPGTAGTLPPLPAPADGPALSPPLPAPTQPR